jgi:hypothetical protein
MLAAHRDESRVLPHRSESAQARVNLAKDFDPAQATPARTLIHKDA